MPAIITHDRFGRDVLDSGYAPFVSTQAERDAFLLGNQGPDPLFYAVIDPRLSAFHGLGSFIHEEEPSKLLAAFPTALKHVPRSEIGVCRAWAAGFTCHYLLDVTAHPFVYAQEYALCDAGVEGLSRKDGTEVHAVIESELDEMMLYTRTGLTVAEFQPNREILQASEETLRAISQFHARALAYAYGLSVAPDLFERSVKGFRLVQGFFHSKRGIKREVVTRIEQKLRPFSFYRAMSHRPIAAENNEFDNHEHKLWTNPFTNAVSSTSFNEIFAEALDRAAVVMPEFVNINSLTLSQAKKVTDGLNFSGKPKA